MHARMQARAHAHASPMQARASTCSHMQVRDCNTNSHATHIICNLHTQQTHTILTLQLSLATLTCNSHMQHNMACSRRTSACTDYFSGLHVQLRCKAHAAISRQCKHEMHRTCIVFASYLHRVCMGLHAHASPMQVRETPSDARQRPREELLQLSDPIDSHNRPWHLTHARESRQAKAY